MEERGTMSDYTNVPILHATHFIEDDANMPFAHGTEVYSTPVYSIQGATSPEREATALHSTDRSSQVLLPTDGQDRLPLSPECKRDLREKGYTDGLVASLERNKSEIPLRIWVVDNSGSMLYPDGNRFIVVKNKGTKEHALKQTSCTRWEELKKTVEYHAQMAAMMIAPTVFRMLNDPGLVAGCQQFSVAERVGDINQDLEKARLTMENATPDGATPLLGHLNKVRENIRQLEQELRDNRSKVVVVLATDAIPTDGNDNTIKEDLISVLQTFQGLPVWVVVRLCTDDSDVTNFWNNVDQNLELSLEVLDDFAAEAKEVHRFNPWLNYGMPLHRMREMGFYDRILDLLDERKLTEDELHKFFKVLFGEGKMTNVPKPEDNWDVFITNITRLNNEESQQWNTINERLEYWVDLHMLKKAYGPPGLFKRIYEKLF